MITQDQKDEVRYRIEEEGLDYTFQGYSDWREVDDEEFHRLRKNFLDAAAKLE